MDSAYSNSQTNILICDDHEGMRNQLRTLLEAESSFKVVGEAIDGCQVLDCVRKMKPDVLVLDISIPCKNGLEVMSEIAQENLPCSVICVSMYADRRIIKKVLELGAKGFIPKEYILQDLVSGIKSIHKGKVFLSESIRELVTISSEKETFIEKKQRDLENDRLLLLLKDNKSLKQIAKVFDMPEDDLLNIVRKLMNSLGLKTLGDLREYARWDSFTTL